MPDLLFFISMVSLYIVTLFYVLDISLWVTTEENWESHPSEVNFGCLLILQIPSYHIAYLAPVICPWQLVENGH